MQPHWLSAIAFAEGYANETCEGYLRPHSGTQEGLDSHAILVCMSSLAGGDLLCSQGLAKAAPLISPWPRAKGNSGCLRCLGAMQRHLAAERMSAWELDMYSANSNQQSANSLEESPAMSAVEQNTVQNNNLYLQLQVNEMPAPAQDVNTPLLGAPVPIPLDLFRLPA